MAKQKQRGKDGEAKRWGKKKRNREIENENRGKGKKVVEKVMLCKR